MLQCATLLLGIPALMVLSIYSLLDASLFWAAHDGVTKAVQALVASPQTVYVVAWLMVSAITLAALMEVIHLA